MDGALSNKSPLYFLENAESVLALDWPADPGLAPKARRVVVSSSVDAPGGPWSAVLLKRGLAEIQPDELTDLHDRLVEDGKLVLLDAGPIAPELPRSFVRVLSESGFVALENIELDGGRLVVSRRDTFTIRRYQDGDDAGIEDLFRASFHVERAREHWRWKYHENPFGNRFISLAISPAEEIASHYSGYPVPFWCEGKDYLALQMGDTMTGPAFRNVGRGTTSLLARTVRHFFSVHRGESFDFFYGFNTGSIQRFCRWFIGGTELEPVRYVQKSLGSESGFDGKGYEVEEIERVDAAFDTLFSKAAPHYGFLVRRDARYLHWRYLSCPDQKITFLKAARSGRLVGWAAFAVKEQRLIWGDSLFDPDHISAAEALLDAALSLHSVAGLRSVVGWFPARPRFWDEELTRLGFEALAEPNRLKFMFLPDGDEIAPLGGLYYTMGDGDLF